VPAAESARRLLAALAAEPVLLEGVDAAALPASVEVALAPEVRDVIAMSPSVRALRGAPGVADIVVDEPADGRLAQALAAARTLAWTGAALLAGLALIVVLAAVRVQLDRDRRELAVAQLLGAGPGFLVVPTVLAGALSGLAAAGLAALGVGLGVHLHGGAIAPHLVVPGGAELAAFLAAGAVLGGLGGGLAGASRVAR
jgi:cell division transport system permease protein